MFKRVEQGLKKGQALVDEVNITPSRLETVDEGDGKVRASRAGRDLLIKLL